MMSRVFQVVVVIRLSSKCVFVCTCEYLSLIANKKYLNAIRCSALY